MRKRHNEASLRLLTPSHLGNTWQHHASASFGKDVTNICLTTLDKVVGMFWFPCYSSYPGVLYWIWIPSLTPHHHHLSSLTLPPPRLTTITTTGIFADSVVKSKLQIWVFGCPYEMWGWCYISPHNMLKELQYICINMSLRVKPHLDTVLFHHSQFLIVLLTST